MCDGKGLTVFRWVALLTGLVFFWGCSSALLDEGNNPYIEQYVSETIVNQAAPAGSPVAKYGLLKVVGNRICDQNSNPVQLRGMSMFWSQWSASWWNASVVNNLAASPWKISIIRAAMGVESGGYLSDKVGQKALVTTVVNAAINKGIYVIIDWHDHAAHQTVNSNASISFFTEMANTYKNVPNVIFEIYNEPVSSWATIKPYHNSVIKAIRDTGANNLIVVGTPTWSQDVDVASTSKVTGSNIAYTLHFYAGSHSQSLRDKANTAMANGCAIMVTEYGTCDASGNGNFNSTETANWYAWMDQNKITSCNWEVFDKAETAAAFVTGASTTGPWADSALTPSGLLVRNYIKANNNWGSSAGGTSSSKSSVKAGSSSSRASSRASSTGSVSSSGVVYTLVTAPFTFEGAGTRHWKMTSIPNYENNWSSATVKINGMDVSGLYKTTAQLPAKQGGYYYIDYIGTLSYSHFEAK